MPKRQWNSSQLTILKTLDQEKETNRAYIKFSKAIKTPSTLKSYNYALDKFMIQSKITSYDDAIKIKADRIQDYLEDYVISLKNLRYNTANQYLSAVELFFDMSMVLYHKRILRKLLPSNDQEQGGKLPYTTEEINRMLSVTIKLRSKAVIHYFASTGCRPASVEDPILRLKHLDDMPYNCKSVYVYDGSKEGYFAFLTPEAAKAMNDFFKQRKLNGETLTDESPVFSNSPNFPTTKQEHMSQSSIRQIIRDAVSKGGIERIKTGKRYDKAEIYGFRKRFNTVLKLNNEVNSNIAEKLMAHKRGLDGTYLQPTKEECFTEFVKAISELTIDPTKRQEFKITEQQEEITELQEKETTIQELKKAQEEMKNRLDKIDLEEKLLKLFSESQSKLSEAIRNKEDEDKIIELVEKTNKLEKQYSEVAYDFD